MLEEKKIDRAAWEAARKAPLGAAPHFDHVPATAYFVEEVRRAVESQFGSKQMLEGGLTVETTLDPAMQAIAERQVREGVVALQRRQGWPGARRNILGGDLAGLAGWHDESWPFVRWAADEPCTRWSRRSRPSAPSYGSPGARRPSTPRASGWDRQDEHDAPHEAGRRHPRAAGPGRRAGVGYWA